MKKFLEKYYPAVIGTAIILNQLYFDGPVPRDVTGAVLMLAGFGLLLIQIILPPRVNA